ncbi:MULTISPECIES: transporter substrate-binding domain-containing protein [Leuconostoc]|uniref:transporter substrate-binding domain-containing protein n=1 Tax=Leuconostoc TaxID=1243 RepID=UPI0021A27425|nr:MULTISPECIES: transporter substrate-binding domain-containing protein [Leuconostoc]MCT3048506.1 amino acid ABC transporter substrate-binding protein [Leuconostoc mesenteroides]MDN6068819.1 transporter substrate-binding domain-containing protein [Leuconostoc sp.]MDN6081166.1 transporter substrate-binding domain-containing protein [Leuconostoc sp.]
MVNKKGIITAAVAVVIIGGGLTIRHLNADSNKAAAKKVRTINVAHTQNYVPYDYVKNGVSKGYEVDVLKAVDKLLPDYKFKYHPTSDEDLLVGLDSGKYDVGVKGAWWTKERAKKYILPKQAVGASIIGITYRKDDNYKSFAEFAKKSGKLVPISPQNGQYAVVQEWNKKHPNEKITLKLADQFTVGDAYNWVLEGRYDAYFDVKVNYQNSVVKSSGAYHSSADKLAYTPYKGIKTYPIISRANKDNSNFSKEYDQAIKKLQKNGTLEKLSQKYFKENVWDFVGDK